MTKKIPQLCGVSGFIKFLTVENPDGYMRTGWIDWNGKQYFCDPSGAMLENTVTPDGFQVGADGARIG